MTSANVTYYEVYKDGKFIDSVSQHCYCKCTYKEELTELFPSPKDYTLIVRWPDEKEDDYYSKEINLEDFLNGKEVEWPEDEEINYYMNHDIEDNYLEEYIKAWQTFYDENLKDDPEQYPEEDVKDPSCYELPIAFKKIEKFVKL